MNENEAGKSKKSIIIAIVAVVVVAIAVTAVLIYRSRNYDEFTLPKEFVGDMSNSLASSDKDVEITLNDDGSVTYRMPKSKHEELMIQVRETIDGSLVDMTTSDSAVFSSVTHNSDYTEFTVTCKADSVGLSESISRVALYYMGGFYNLYNGTPADNIKVIYLDPSGNIMEETNSIDDDGLGEQLQN